MPISYSGTQQVEAIKPKDPQAELPFGFDWSIWLESAGNLQIANSVWDVTGPDNSLTTANPDTPGNTKSTVFLRGGTVGGKYLVRNSITTTGTTPLRDDRTLVIEVIER